MKFGIVFVFLAAVIADYAWLLRPWGLFLLWPALSFFLVATAYLGIGPRVFGKRRNGRLRPLSSLLLCPFLLYTWLIWFAVSKWGREAAFNRITEKLVVGRRLTANELPEGLSLVVDLTCEFDEPRDIVSRVEYCSFPTLDATAPPAAELEKLVRQLRSKEGTVYVHCAQGHGRTGLVAAAVLFASGGPSDASEALEAVRSARPGVRLQRSQKRCLNEVCARLRPPSRKSHPSDR